MGKNSPNNADILFWNRQSFLRFNQFRIDQTLKTLSKNHRLVFLTLPRLLHVNQEGLPGYFDPNVPSGIHSFDLDRQSQLAAETLFPHLITRRNENLFPIIHSMLIMGSVGSIAQTDKSDLDYTLLVNKESLTEENLSLFRKKLDLIENWIWEEYHLETHFFINDYNEYRHNIFGESDSESTGSALAKLLKEEMFRTMIIVAGKIPFWWIVPAETGDNQYERLLHLMNSSQTLLNREEFLDLGNVEDISEGEFFGGSIWALIKSFKSPFKTLLKMGLLEDYMFGDTRFNLLCHEIKTNVFEKFSLHEADPYIALFQRVQQFFEQSKSEEDLDTLRTAFYMKVGTKITAEEMKKGSSHFKKGPLIKLIKDWGWSLDKVEHLNEFDSWQMKQKVALGSRVNKVLMTSYRNISEKNKTLDSKDSLITEKDTHLLGRKLFSFYRRAPNKVENLVSLVDGNTAESELTFALDQHDENEKPTWYLTRGKSLTFIEYVDPENIIKKTATLPFLIAFTAFNKLFRSQTRIWIKSGVHSIKEYDLRVLLNQLTAFTSQVDISAISNQDLMADDHIRKLYLIVDFGIPLPREVIIGNINRCKTDEELSRFVDRRLERIKHLSAVSLTSWGELFCKTYSGMNCMGRCLDQVGPQILPESTEQRNFLKIYIPSGRKEILQIPWLDNYVTRALISKIEETQNQTVG